MTQSATKVGYNVIYLVVMVLAQLAVLSGTLWVIDNPHQTYTAFLTVYPGALILYASIAGMIVFCLMWSLMFLRALLGKPAIAITEKQVTFFTWRAYQVDIASIDRCQSMVVGGKILEIADSKRQRRLRFRLVWFEEDAMAKLQAAVGFDLEHT